MVHLIATLSNNLTATLLCNLPCKNVQHTKKILHSPFTSLITKLDAE